MQLRTSEGVAEFTVAGTYAVVGPGFGVVAGTPDAARFGAGRPNAFLVDAVDGVDEGALVYAVATELGAEYDLVIDTPESTKDFAFSQLRGFFSLAYVILIAAAVAGLLGLANTLAVVGAGRAPTRSACSGRRGRCAARSVRWCSSRRSRSPWSRSCWRCRSGCS